MMNDDHADHDDDVDGNINDREDNAMMHFKSLFINNFAVS